MTAVVGILCEDGIVIGTDSSATFAAGDFRTIEQKCKKIEIVANKTIVAGTGQMGMGQRFCSIVEQAEKSKVFNQPPIKVGSTLSKMAVEEFASTRATQGQYGALVAHTTGKDFYLIEFQVKDFQPELKTTNDLLFVSMGSGQPITDPFLGLMRKVFWNNEIPSVSTAIFVTTWTLQHAIELNTGGINAPIQMAVIKRFADSPNYEARELSQSDLLEHQNNVEEVEEYLGKYKDILLGKEGVSKIPSIAERD